MLRGLRIVWTGLIVSRVAGLGDEIFHVALREFLPNQCPHDVVIGAGRHAN
jgi:hypothetical protein